MKKYLFTQMFDEDVIEQRRVEAMARLEEERSSAENAPPTYTVEELETAKEIALQQGIANGRAEAMTSIQQHASITLDSIERHIGGLLDDHKTWTAAVHHDSISLSLAIMRKLAPELLRGSELPQVEHIIHEAFEFLTDQPKVMIRVAAELEEHLQGKVELMASRVGYEGQVVLTGDPELELTDCRISWYAGAVERALDETWGQIDEMVDRVLRGLPARERPEPVTEKDTDTEEMPPDGSELEAVDTDVEADLDSAVADQADNGDDAPPQDTDIDPAIAADATDDATRGSELPEFEDVADIPAQQPSTKPERALATQEIDHG